jgi:hypothetical protein
MKKNIENYSSLQKIRLEYKPKVPSKLKEETLLCYNNNEDKIKKEEEEEIKKIFPKTYSNEIIELKKGEISSENKKELKVGILLSGGQAP